MENEISIFENELGVDAEVNSYLRQTAGWAKLVGLAGMLFAVVTTLKTLHGIVKIVSIVGSRYFSIGSLLTNMAIPFLSIAAFFAIGLFTFRFANKMKSALAGNQQNEFDNAWYNLKIAYRLVGIVLGIYLLLLIVVVIFMSSYS